MHIKKVAKHCKGKKNHDNWLKKKKVIQSKNVLKISKKFKIFRLKIHKGDGILKKLQNLNIFFSKRKLKNLGLDKYTFIYFKS